MPASEEVTLGRIAQVEKGEGLPPTASEREAVTELRSFMQGSPYWQGVEVVAKQWAKAKPFYEAASPSDKRRLGNLTPSEVLALHAKKLSAGAPHEQASGRRVRPSARASRSRSARTSRAKARSPARSDDPEPHLEPVPLCRFRQDVRRWLEGVA
jgi:hypothetical protein